MKILAVDDDTFILELLCMVAARAGFKDVSTALSGEIALDMLRSSETPFDCLVLDISMPEMAGIELCALARAMPAYEKTPIIMLTAMAEKVFVDRAFAAGATDYANKPFDIVELSTRLRMAEELVSARRAADAMDFDAATDPTDPRKPPLSHEIRIDGIKSLIDYAALKNYLAQLSLTGIACSQVLAFKIDQIEELYVRASNDEFLYALTEVASAICQAMQNYQPMIAYAGNGIFLAVSGKSNLEPSATLESDIQFILDDRDIQFDDASPLDIDVSAGNPIRPIASMLHRAQKTFDRAIARAESRMSRKHNTLQPPSIRILTR